MAAAAGLRISSFKAGIKSNFRKLAPRAVRPYRILRGPLKGRIILTSLYDYPGAILGRTEKPLLAWFQQNVKPGQTWLDVGAHYGYTAIALAELVGPEGRVFAFEPSLTTAGHLNRTRLLNKLVAITVVPIGLGESSELRITAVQITRGMANHALGGSQFENIYLIGFDRLWTSLGGGPIHGVKIDVQGMELQTLAGMSRSLSEQRPKLVVEFHPGVSRKPILNLLALAGYQLPAKPLEPAPSETEAAYHDDRSYSFEPTPRT
jgi:FkbM family methyltransferase